MKYRFGSLGLVLAVIMLFAIQGCKEADKTKVKQYVFKSHQIAGASLEEAKNVTNRLYKTGVINKNTYSQIRVNWLRARDIYGEASIIGEKIIQFDDFNNVNQYFSLLTQVQIIAADIVNWASEPQTKIEKNSVDAEFNLITIQ